MEAEQIEQLAAQLGRVVGGSTPDQLGLDVADCARLIGLGTSSFACKMDGQAERIFRMVAMLWPASYLPDHYVGMIAERGGHLESAADYYRSAGQKLEALEALSPDQQEVLRDIEFLLAGVLLQLGQDAEARLYLADLLSKGNALPTALRAQIRALAEVA